MAGAIAIVQARMSSTRLPGKVIANVGGEPMLTLLLRRLQQAQAVERVLVATSTEPADDVIEAIASAHGCGVFRGSRDDVLARFVGAVGDHPGPVVRLTADCPLIDPSVVDEVIHLFHRTRGCAYASNIEPRTFPDGLDVEVLARESLERVAGIARDASDREHVTTAIRRDPDLFLAAVLVSAEDLGDLRWTVDTTEDLDFVRLVVDRLGHRRYTARMEEILAAVRQAPSLADRDGRRG